MKKELSKIFILEDDENLNYLHTMLIKSIGIKNVLSCSNLTDALLQLKHCFDTKIFPDILFIDLDLPDNCAIKFLTSYEADFGRFFSNPKIVLFSDFPIKEMSSFKSILTHLNKPLLRADFIYMLENKDTRKNRKLFFRPLIRPTIE